MSEGFTVASLDAPIRVTIPKEKIDAFKKDLHEIRETLEHVVRQMADMGKVVDKNFKAAGKNLKFQVIQQKESLAQSKKQTEEEEKKNSNAKRTAKVYGEWVNKLAQVRVLTGLIRHHLGNIAKLVLVPTAMFAGLATLASRVNATTTEMANLSEATGFNINDMRALGLEAKKLGFNFQNVRDTVEEMNNKIGGEGVAPEIGLREGLEALNLTVEDIKDLKPDQQLSKIMKAAMSMKKAGRPLAELSSAFDKMFGGEGNILYTHFLQSMEKGNLTWEEFIGNARKFTSLSDTAVAGAKSFTGAFNSITEAIRTVSGEFFGQFGAKLSPFFDTFLGGFGGMYDNFVGLLDPLTDMLADTLIDGFSLLTDVMDWIRERPEEVALAFQTLVDVLKTMFKVGVDLAKILSALVPALYGILKVLSPILEFVSSLLASDFVRYLVMITASLMAAYYAGLYLIAGLGVLLVTTMNLASGFISVASAIAMAGASLKAFFIAGATGAGGLLLVLGKVLAIIGSIAAVGYGVYKLFEALFEMTGYTDAMSNVLASDDLAREASVQRDAEARTKQALEQMRINRANLAQGSIGTSNSNVDNSSRTNYSNTSVVNHNYVQDPSTGKEFMEKVVNGKPF